MNINLPYILVTLILISGLIWLVDSVFLAKKRMAMLAAGQKDKKPLVVDYAKSFFPLLIIVLIFRSFVIQPFKVPTGSLMPTIEPGDFIAVNMYKYGLRLPLTHTKILNVDPLHRGDIALFRWPTNPKINFIKRVIGLPGDHISYINKVLYINGKQATQVKLGNAIDHNCLNGPVCTVDKIQENLNGVNHDILINPAVPPHNFFDIVVPKGKYFMMGDNRDNSDDSRYWGFVPDQNIIGKAFGIWFSWDSITDRVRWDRIFTELN